MFLYNLPCFSFYTLCSTFVALPLFISLFFFWKMLLQAETKNTGLNKRQVGVPSGPLPPTFQRYYSVVRGPELGEAIFPRGGPLWLPFLSCLWPTSSGARKDKTQELSMSLFKGFCPLEGLRKRTKGQFPISQPSLFLPFLWREVFNWQRLSVL